MRSAIERSAERPLYATLTYARAFGFAVVDVEDWNTALLVRDISGSNWQDALGCYPLSLISADADLDKGLDRLRAANLVSVALVPDPVTGPSEESLRATFPVCRRFKTHFLIDRAAGPLRFSATHRRWIRKALRECEVAPVSLSDSLADWTALYEQTVDRRDITNLQRFSHGYFAALAEMPQVSAFAAKKEGDVVAMALWVQAGKVVYYHLGASNRRGYETQAMYGIFAAACEHFNSAEVLHLGGAAGTVERESDGLAQFKRGFANRKVPAYFCGASLDAERYLALTKNRPATTFFPAYRDYD